MRMTRQACIAKMYTHALLAIACIAMLSENPCFAATFCNIEAQSKALQDFYAETSGPEWHKATGWTDPSRSCEIQGVTLPSHCCWYGIKCCIHHECLSNMRPHRDACGCEVGLVLEIQLQNNRLAGNFSLFDHQAFACELKILKLAGNALYGGINLDFVVHQKLQSVELHDNNLRGTLPTGIGRMPNLENLWIHGNALEGPVPSDICGSSSRLFSLILDDNGFSGPLDLSYCDRLNYFGAKNNMFQDVFSLNEGLPDLRGFYLEGIGLRGSLPEDLFIDYMPRLEHIHLLNNRLTGHLPEMSTFSFTYIFLSANRLVGRIPMSWAIVARPNVLVALNSNYLSCCGVDPLPPSELEQGPVRSIDEVYRSMDYNAPLLPPFLELSDDLEPVFVTPGQSFNAAGLRCPKLRLVDGSIGPASSTQWFIDPSYYLFAKCECDQGLELVNLTRPGRLFYFECQRIGLEEPSSDKPWQEAHPWAVIIIVVIGLLLVLLFISLLYLYKGTEAVQWLSNIKKRTKGLPCSGPFTAVVTDIEGWTVLCAEHPEISDRVLSIHNAILRNAKWCNFGRTHEMEGDSWTIVFFDAKDAAAFCLQAQQLLSNQEWPSPKNVQSTAEETRPMTSGRWGLVNKTNSKKGRRSSYTLLQGFSRSQYMSSGEHAKINIRVRMGIASGFLQPGESLHSHPTIAGAKEVSDAAFGGQIFVDRSTFAAIKDSLEELGTVDAQGMHLDRLRVRRILGWSAGLLKCCVSPPRPRRDALLLDMGCYVQPKGEQQEAQKVKPSLNSSTSLSKMSQRLSKLFHDGPSKHSPAEEELQLFQLLSASHAECSKEWGSRQRLRKEDWVLKSSLYKPYFDAPGTQVAPLGDASSSANCMPMLTMVFATMEDAKMLSNKGMRQVERLLLACASSCLDQVEEDGYLCSVLGNLKLKLCFSRPEAALAWSCAMQDCMMKVAWPRSATKEPFQTVYNQGSLVFRGPRLKIGISEGRPVSIQPDHLGRADYYGDCVNSAARFMEGAAQGGMVVCEQELAIKAMKAWATSPVKEEGGELLQLTTRTSQSNSFTCSGSISLRFSQSGHMKDSAHVSQSGGTTESGHFFQSRKNMKLSQSETRSVPSPSLNGSTTKECAPSASAMLPPLEDDDDLAATSLAVQRRSEPLKFMLPPPPDATCIQGLIQECRSSYRERLKNVHVFWLGLFRFKGISGVRKMVHVLLDELAPRAATYASKPASLASATLISQLQPSGSAISTFIVPTLPVLLDPRHLVHENREHAVRISEAEGTPNGSAKRASQLSAVSFKLSPAPCEIEML